MAQKRMFSLSVTDTDDFMDMPTSTQALYFHLGMHGDDDGFVGSPRKITRAAGCAPDDLKLLITKGFLIPFDSGVVVIRDWKINNTLKNDRYHETVYVEEKAALLSDSVGRYYVGTELETPRNQIVSSMEPEHNITEHNETEPSPEKQIEEAGKPPRAKRFVPPTVEEIKAYCRDRKNGIDAQRLFDYYTANGWVQGKGKPIKDWKAVVRTWERGTGSDIRTPDKYTCSKGESL